jgi:MFS family permease
VKTVLAGVFVNRLTSFLSIFLVLYVASKGYSTELAAAALAIYGAGGVVGSLIGGALADRLGPRNATVISMAGVSVLTASLLFLPSYTLLTAAVALIGLAAQIFRPTSAKLLSDLTPERRQVMIFAMHRFGLNLGAMAAPLIGFALYGLDHQQYTVLFLGEALMAMVYAALAWFVLPVDASRAVEETAHAAARPRSGYSAVLRDRRYLLYLLAALLQSAVYVQYLSTLPLTVNAAGVKIVWYTVAVSLNGFIVIAFELLTTKVTQRWPMRVPIALGFVLVGTGMGVYGLPIGPAVIIGGTLVWSLGEIIGGPSVSAYPAVAGPPQLRGRYIGSFQFMFGLGTAVGPILGGWLFIQIGHAAWFVLAAGSLAAALFGLAAVRPPASRRVVGDPTVPAVASPDEARG